MILPAYNLDKIKFATDEATFAKAVDLHDSGKVTKFKEDIMGYSAVVLGTHPYKVYVSLKKYDDGSCDCYLGQNETLCKHMVALAIYALKRGKELSYEERKLTVTPECSGKIGNLTKEELVEIKEAITSAMKCIKSYNGPSRTWFAYQDSLSEGVRRLTKIVSELPIGEETAGLLVDLSLRLDRKLTHGAVDDSDGTVGGFIEELVMILQEYAKLDINCVNAFKKLCDKETCFGWEEPLVRMYDKKII